MPSGFVYILTNYSRTLYTGVTSDLRGRTGQHRDKAKDGFTNRYNIDQLVYYEEYQDIRDAIAREKQIKGMRRSKKIALIEAFNPDWKDLTRDIS